MSIKKRGIASAALFGVWSLGSIVIQSYVPVISGEVAVRQLENSDAAYVSSQVTAHYLHLANGALSLLCLGALASLWWGPLSRFFKNGGTTAAMLILITAISAVQVHPAHAYYSKYNYSDPVEIQPNWTVFAIPETGKNLDSQGRFQSEEYLNKQKVAEKRFIVPHDKMPNTGWLSDYYVPTLRLIIVDRPPYHREWTSSATTGTSTKNEGFCMETKDSINVCFAITIGAEIKEPDAAKYLYNFGTVVPTKGTNPNDENTPEAITFASYVFARPLAEVMDTVGRSLVQSYLAEEFGSRSTLDALHQKKEIITLVYNRVKTYFADRGVTIGWTGFASPLSFDTDPNGHSPIQEAINKAFIAEQDAAAAKTIESVLPILKEKANIELANGLAASAGKWNGQLPAWPSVVTLPSNSSEFLAGVAALFSGQRQAPAIASPLNK